MGRGSSKGLVIDYYKEKGQPAKGEGGRRQKLSKKSKEKRARMRAEARSERKKAERTNPSHGINKNKPPKAK